MQRPLACLCLALSIACKTQDTQLTTENTAKTEGISHLLLIVVDGLPTWLVNDHLSDLRPDGIRRFMTDGTWMAEGQYTYAGTFTAAGHATLATGTTPHQHGIVANTWWDSSDRTSVYAVHPKEVADQESASKDDAVSPDWLEVPTLLDILAEAGLAQTFAVAIKDRAAAFLAGKSGTPYFYHRDAGQFESSKAYMAEPPGWWHDFYAAEPQLHWFDPEASGEPAAELDVDSSGDPRQIFMAEDLANKSDYFSALRWSPQAPEYVTDFALAMMDGENLWEPQAEQLQVVIVGYSSQDYVGHIFGPESEFAHQQLLAVDKSVARLLDSFEQAGLLGSTLVGFTADHGFHVSPEHAAVQGLDAGRLATQDLVERLNEVTEAEFGLEDAWQTFTNPGVYLDQDVALRLETRLSAFLSSYADWLKQNLEGIEEVYTSQELRNGVDSLDLDLRRAALSWHRDRGGDLVIIPKPNWLIHTNPRAIKASHGTPHWEDRWVPWAVLSPEGGEGVVDDEAPVQGLLPAILLAADPAFAELLPDDRSGVAWAKQP